MRGRRKSLIAFSASILIAIPGLARTAAAQFDPGPGTEPEPASSRMMTSSPPNAGNCSGCHLDQTSVAGTNYVMYRSPTMDMFVDSRPGPVSLPCLECHGSSEKLPPGSDERLDLGRDLRNDHPIAVVYDPTRDRAFEPITTRGDGRESVGALPLFDRKIECVTCHDPHSERHGAIRSTTRPLCVTCHRL